MSRVALALVPALLTAACATGRPSAPEPPIVAEPANARVRLYADCVGASVRGDSFERYGRYIRYRCTGVSAQALYEASAVYVQSRGQERTEGARTLRLFTTRAWDDGCWREGGAYGCSLTQPVGEFLDPARDVAPRPKPKH